MDGSRFEEVTTIGHHPEEDLNFREPVIFIPPTIIPIKGLDVSSIMIGPPPSYATIKRGKKEAGIAATAINAPAIFLSVFP